MEKRRGDKKRGKEGCVLKRTHPGTGLWARKKERWEVGLQFKGTFFWKTIEKRWLLLKLITFQIVGEREKMAEEGESLCWESSTIMACQLGLDSSLSSSPSPSPSLLCPPSFLSPLLFHFFHGTSLSSVAWNNFCVSFVTCSDKRQVHVLGERRRNKRILEWKVPVKKKRVKGREKRKSRTGLQTMQFLAIYHSP